MYIDIINKQGELLETFPAHSNKISALISLNKGDLLTFFHNKHYTLTQIVNKAYVPNNDHYTIIVE
jgi:hypothetical protein